jgi:hypothetical protein
MTTPNEPKLNEVKRNRISQDDMPQFALAEVVALAEALKDNFAGKDATPINLANAIGRSPSSSSWRYLTGAAVAYGITDGGYGSKFISLTSLGKQIVNPTYEGATKAGLSTAVLRPTILKSFYVKFNGAKLPKDEIAKNILEELGVPKDRTSDALQIIIENAKYVGILTNTANGQYIQLDVPKSAPATSSPEKEMIEKSGASSDVRPPANPTVTEMKYADGKIILQIESSLLRDKELREKVFALLDASQALEEAVEKPRNKVQDQNSGKP